MGDQASGQDWQNCKRGVDDRAKELKFAEKGLSTRMMFFSTNALENQINYLEAYASGKFGGLAIVPEYPDNSRIGDLLTSIKEQGTPVITIRKDIDTKLFPKAREYYIGNKESDEGSLLGILAAQILTKKGYPTAEYATFMGASESFHTKRAGFLAGMALAQKEKLYTERAKYVDYSSLDDIRRAADGVILRNDPVKMLVGYSIDHLRMISGSLEDQDQSKNYFLIGMGYDQWAIDALKANKIDAIIVNNQYFTCFDAATALYYVHTDDTKKLSEMFPDGVKEIARGPIVVVRNNFNLVDPDDLPSNTRFMNADDFQALFRQRN
jgi:ABC-type sugar transport system substrate-binding protein